MTYGFDRSSNFRINNVRKSKDNSKFNLVLSLVGKKQTQLKNFQIPLLGNHNISNATAAIAVALNLGIKIKVIKKALKNFIGVQRRFNKIFSHNKIDFYDDYAHHPTEIKALLKGTRSVYKSRKIISVFQPHRFSRTRELYFRFIEELKKIDILFICDIYPVLFDIVKCFNFYI